MPFSVYARGDSSTANNASLNVESYNQQPTVLLTFEAAAGGDEDLEFNDGLPDPDTVVYVDGDPTPLTFTMEFGGYLPQSNKLSNVGGVDLRGAEIRVLTLENGDRYFFVVGSDGSATWLNIMDSFPNGAHSIDFTFACYALGTLIRTPFGDRPVQDLVPGDHVLTNKGRKVRVRYVARRSFTATEVKTFAPLTPILISAGTLGPGQPENDLTVSALHRILVRDGDLERLFGLEAAYIAARDLPFARPAPATDITYVHFLCDDHECVLANGCESESLFPGDVIQAALTPEDRKAVREIACGQTRTAYPCLTAKEATVWAAARSAREGDTTFHIREKRTA